MKDQFFLEKKEFEQRTKAALSWLKQSFDVNKEGGSSAYYTQFWKPFSWARAYPETTGYIIETLLDYEKLYPDWKLRDYALRAANWICTLQLKDGALPGGISGSKKPSIFNTGQMIFGLVRAYELTYNQKYYDVFNSAAYWLTNSLENDGSWKKAAYVQDHVPSYYTRAIWPVLLANQYIKDPVVTEKMTLALTYYHSRLTPKSSIKYWAFRKGQKAFTHTIAYTIRGFFESSLLLNNKELNDLAINLADKVMSLRELKGKLAGWYDEEWNGDYWFTCLTGNCQMAIIFCRIYEQTNDPRFLNTALKVFGDVINHQNMGGNINKRGALPGSYPFYGRYMAFRYPNWATKFFLDAYFLISKNIKTLERAL